MATGGLGPAGGGRGGALQRIAQGSAVGAPGSFQAGLGTVLTYADAKETPVKDLNPDAFWKALTGGGAWTQKDARRIRPLAAGKPAVTFSQPESAIDLPLIAIREPHNPGLVSPLMTSSQYWRS